MRSDKRDNATTIGMALLATILTTMLIGPTALGAQAVAPSGPVLDSTLLEPNQKTAEISTNELQQVLGDGSAVVFDSRPHMEYAVSHIPGALNVAPKPGLPMSQYVSDVAEINRIVAHQTTPIVLYCNGP